MDCSGAWEALVHYSDVADLAWLGAIGGLGGWVRSTGLGEWV